MEEKQMNKYAVRVRIRAIAILSAASFVIIAANPNVTHAQTASPANPPTTISVPDSLSFPGTAQGDTFTENLIVNNTGKTVPLFISSVTSSDPAEFAVGISTCPSQGTGLAPGHSCTIAIGFKPNDLGLRRATLKISDNTATSPQSVALSGGGSITMMISPNGYEFHTVKVGSTASGKLTVYNLQSIPVSLSERFGGSNARDFSITGGTCTATQPAKSDCSLLVTFAPTAVGTVSGFLEVSVTPDPLSPYALSLVANAVAAPPPEPTP
jgi:hypothetical protein